MSTNETCQATYKNGILISVGDDVLVYGGNSPHDKYSTFCNGVEMTVLEIRPASGAHWVLCRHDDRNEKTIREYWFLIEQLQTLESE